MPDAKTVEIADGVVSRLNVPGRFSAPFTAARAWDVLYTLEELASLHVTAVAARSEEDADEARSTRLITHEIQVGVQQRVTAESVAALNAACDPLAYLAQQIADYFAGADADASMDAEFGVRHESSAVALYDAALLRQERVFLSVVTLRWREWRAR